MYILICKDEKNDVLHILTYKKWVKDFKRKSTDMETNWIKKCKNIIAGIPNTTNEQWNTVPTGYRYLENENSLTLACHNNMLKKKLYMKNLYTKKLYMKKLSFKLDVAIYVSNVHDLLCWDILSETFCGSFSHDTARSKSFPQRRRPHMFLSLG